MKITKIIIENFKSFGNRIVIDTNKPIVCFVGENNTGKTTIFRALNFLRNGVEKDKSIDDYKNSNNLTRKCLCRNYHSRKYTTSY